MIVGLLESFWMGVYGLDRIGFAFEVWLWTWGLVGIFLRDTLSFT